MRDTLLERLPCYDILCNFCAQMGRQTVFNGPLFHHNVKAKKNMMMMKKIET